MFYFCFIYTRLFFYEKAMSFSSLVVDAINLAVY